MAIPSMFLLPLLQGVTTADTLVAKTVPVRGVFEWTSGILQIVVLLLGIGVLITAMLMLMAMKKGFAKIEQSVEKLTTEARPLIANAKSVIDDTREIVAMVRTDVERVTDAAAAISEQLLDAAETTASRVDELNAVIDVLQAELEATAIGTVSAIRGVRVGASELGSQLISPRRQRASADGAAFDVDDDDYDDEE